MPRYILKNIIYLDENRQSFTAELHRVKKKVASIHSQCQIVNCSFDWTSDKEREAFEEFISSQPEREFKDYHAPFKIAENVDSFIANLLSEYEFDLWMGELLKKSTVFRLKHDKINEYHVVDEIYSQDVKDRILNEFGDNLDEVFNEKQKEKRK